MRQEEVSYCERALEASRKAKLINPVVYLPKTIRGKQRRLTIDSMKITLEPETIAENHLRIAQSDPLGHLIAAMNGQPIPSFHINDDGSVDVHYEVTPLHERTQIAEFLASRITFKIPSKVGQPPSAPANARAEYDAMIKNALEPKKEEPEDV